jgi:hypothetical protein
MDTPIWKSPMSDVEADRYDAACRSYLTETGEIPQPHYPGICVTLTERECDRCAAFRAQVCAALGEIVGALDKIVKQAPDADAED